MKSSGYSNEDLVPGTKIPVWVALGMAEFIHALCVLADDKPITVYLDEDEEPIEVSAFGVLDEGLRLMGYEDVSSYSQFGEDEIEFVRDLALTLGWLEHDLGVLGTEFFGIDPEEEYENEEITYLRLVNRFGRSSAIERTVVSRDGLIEFSKRMDQVELNLSYPVLAFFLQACILQIHSFLKNCFHEFTPEQLESYGEPCSKCGLEIWDPQGYLDFFSNPHEEPLESKGI